APGWAGDAWVKWLTNLQARADEYDGFWMKTAYRYPARPVGPGSAVDAADMQPVTHLRVKSVIAWPGDGQRLAPGAITARGAAWSGGSPIAHVDFSADSGRTWQAARLSPARPEAARPEAARYGWRLWEATWTPPGRGSYLLMARATDASGATQPLVADWNPSGYLWNAVHQVRVEIGAAQSALPAAGEQRPAPELPAEFRAACTGCHGEDMIAGQRLTRAQWERELDKMARWGATVRPEERPALLDFLVRHFGPQ
ncbi:MAG: hypothetical protein FJW37_11950, partial [Acidobacteria bacterium]|nr:hypothetical protein [Acidobacteriota bacterium]